MGDAGEHHHRTGWLQRWQDTEPLRLHLYGITVPVLAAAVVYGWLTTEQMGAWLAVAAALFVGSTAAGELARRKVWAPASVDLAVRTADDDGYADGLEDGMHRARVQVTTAGPEELQEALERDPQPATAHIQAAGRCRHVESGDRCVLPVHPQEVRHRYE
jgi:hypothetical protein